jgi:Holliday junction resolvasome RuvABC endonuclease subunit
MIFAIDPGTATMGWSIIGKRGEVHELGGMHEEKLKGEGWVVSLRRRAKIQSDLLLSVVPTDLSCIAVEELVLSTKGVAGSASLSLCWGQATLLSAVRSVPLVEVAPVPWQRSIATPSKRPKRGAPDYEHVVERLYAYVLACGSKKAKNQLRTMHKSVISHALDAVGVGVYTAYRINYLAHKPRSKAA